MKIEEAWIRTPSLLASEAAHLPTVLQPLLSIVRQLSQLFVRSYILISRIDCHFRKWSYLSSGSNLLNTYLDYGFTQSSL